MWYFAWILGVGFAGLLVADSLALRWLFSGWACQTALLLAAAVRSTH